MTEKKQELIGKVVSASNNKTITVNVKHQKVILCIRKMLNIQRNMLLMMKKTQQK